MIELLKKLCLANGVSGNEGEVAKIIIDELKDFSPEADHMGNVTVRIKNDGAPKLMLSAHMDEVGFMVTDILEGGELSFGCVGGIDPLVLLSKKVISENGIRGAILSKPVHLLSADEAKVRTEIKDMYIDIGTTSKEQSEKLVEIGDYFTFLGDFVEFGENKIKAKALDDRLGCAIMIEAIKRFAKEGAKSKYDLYFCFTTREEVSYSGAFMTSEKIKPDYALVIESTAVADLANVAKNKRVALQGEGGAISFADRGTIYNKEFTDTLISVCQKNNIKYQIKQYVSGGNDASHIQRSGGGVKVASLSCPSRYIHSQSDVCDIRDINSMFEAVYALICD